MKIEDTNIKGLFVLKRNLIKDRRGTFSRIFADDEIKKLGIKIYAAHVNFSHHPKIGTLRGIHFQYPPYSEKKVIACTSGAIWGCSNRS